MPANAIIAVPSRNNSLKIYFEAFKMDFQINGIKKQIV